MMAQCPHRRGHELAPAIPPVGAAALSPNGPDLNPIEMVWSIVKTRGCREQTAFLEALNPVIERLRVDLEPVGDELHELPPWDAAFGSPCRLLPAANPPLTRA
jgi:hypothetical protein